MRAFLALLILLFSLPGLAEEFLLVERVVDGDTILVEGIGKVRLIGVDTPETKDPRRPVQFFGKEASHFTEALLLGKLVRLEFEQERTDKFGRTLAYVFLPDGTFVNEKLVREGYAHAYTRFPFRHLERFREAEKEAEEAGRGLWANPDIQTKERDPAQQNLRCRPFLSCSKIKTCAEARFRLKACGQGRLDSDKDGVPCEKLCKK